MKGNCRGRFRVGDYSILQYLWLGMSLSCWHVCIKFVEREQSPMFVGLGIAVCTCDLSSHEVNSSGVQGQPELHELLFQ